MPLKFQRSSISTLQPGDVTRTIFTPSCMKLTVDWVACGGPIVNCLPGFSLQYFTVLQRKARALQPLDG